MMRIAFLLCLLFLFSCTVTKRVHRPGYHIEWNKNYSKSARQLANEKEPDKMQDTSVGLMTLSETKITEDHFEEGEEFYAINNDEETIDKVDFSSPKISKETPDKRKGIQGSKKRAFVFERNSIFRPHESKVDDVDDDEDETWEPNGEIIKGIGIGLIILGIMLIIGSMFLVFGFNGLGGLFNSLVFSGNGFFVGLIGFLLFLLILLVIILFVVIVEYVLGSAYTGFVVGTILILAGIVLMLIGYLKF